jgi:1-acyl-sn-glycerol-3-phosphate acyltransferase
MLVVAIPTLFLARRFYSEVIGRWIGRTVLRIWGVDFTTHYSEPLQDRQTVYISNHTSTLDVMLLIALALPRARFFLSGYCANSRRPDHWIHHPCLLDRASTDSGTATRNLSRADRILRRTGDSVYLSPEGKCVTTGEIGAFNKGSFHLATSLKRLSYRSTFTSHQRCKDGEVTAPNREPSTFIFFRLSIRPYGSLRIWS